MYKTDQIYRTHFLGKYVGLSPYDIYLKNRCIIDNEDINFIKGDGYDLIGNPDCQDGTSTYHKYFLLYDGLFDQILATDQNTDIELKVIPKYLLFSSIN